MRLCLSLAVALLLTLAPTALALPGDPGFAPEAPADGASVPVDAGGIPVTFSCPVYRTSDAGGGFAAYGGPKDYGVVMARGSAVGPDGRLSDPVALATASAVPGQDGECSAVLAAGGGDRPQETPGTYFWQVTRICVGCDAGYEVGPIRTLTLVSDVKPTVAVAGRAYAGFPFLAKVAAAGVPDGTAVTVERASGATWAEAGAGTVTQGVAVVTTLVRKRGATKLRARLTVGTQDVTGTAATVAVRSASSRRTAVRAGAWSGKGGVAFRVVGRTIRSFTAQVPMLCPTPGMVSPFTTQIGTATIASIRLAPDGSFVGAATKSGSAIRAYGRLVGSRATGARVQLSLGGCQGNAAFAARAG